jgi:hypothetical protein
MFYLLNKLKTVIMKRILLILGIVVCSVVVKAQPQGTVSLNGYAGYTFDDKIPLELAYAKVMGTVQYGGGLEFFMQDNKSLEVKYMWMNTTIPVHTNGGLLIPPSANGMTDKGIVNYILIGGNNYFERSVGQKIVPFAGADLGVGWINAYGQADAKFAWDAKLGIKIKTSSVVSFKLHAYVQNMISTFGYDYWHTYYGTYAVPDYTALWQLGLGGAICFDFKKR